MPPREMARRWRKRIVKSRERRRAASSDYLEVRYEDLVADTETVLRRVCELVELDFDPAMLTYHERAEERLQEMAGALPAKKGRPEREAGERVAAHALTTKPPDTERVAVWKREMSEDRERRVRGRPPATCSTSSATRPRPRATPGCHPRSGPGRRTAPTAATGAQHAVEARGAPLAISSRLRGGDERLPGRVRGRHEPLRDDAAADDARRPPELTIPPETHFVPDLIKAAREDGATAGGRARGDEVGPRVGRLRLHRRGDAEAAASARLDQAGTRGARPSTRPTRSSRASRAGARRRPPTSRR